MDLKTYNSEKNALTFARGVQMVLDDLGHNVVTLAESTEIELGDLTNYLGKDVYPDLDDMTRIAASLQLDIVISHDNLWFQPHEENLREDSTVAGSFVGEACDICGAGDDEPCAVVEPIEIVCCEQDADELSLALANLEFAQDAVNVLRELMLSGKSEYVRMRSAVEVAGLLGQVQVTLESLHDLYQLPDGERIVMTIDTDVSADVLARIRAAADRVMAER